MYPPLIPLFHTCPSSTQAQLVTLLPYYHLRLRVNLLLYHKSQSPYQFHCALTSGVQFLTPYPAIYPHLYLHLSLPTYTHDWCIIVSNCLSFLCTHWMLQILINFHVCFHCFCKITKSVYQNQIMFVNVCSKS